MACNLQDKLPIAPPRLASPMQRLDSWLQAYMLMGRVIVLTALGDWVGRTLSRPRAPVQALQERFGGWGSAGGEIVPLFAAYAAEVFKTLGDRVVHWTTFNEPATFCFSGYSTGGHAPGVRSLARRLLTWPAT